MLGSIPDGEAMVDDPVARYYQRLRAALLDARREPQLQHDNFRRGVEDVLRNLALLLLDRDPPSDLQDIRKLSPEFRDAGILFLINKRLNGASHLLQWYSDRLEEFGGAERALADPDIQDVRNLMDRLDVEPWRP